MVLHEDRGEWVEESSDTLAYPIPAEDCAECYADCNVDTWVFDCKVDNIVEEGVHLKCTVEFIHKWTNIELTVKGSPLTSFGDVSRVTTTKSRYTFSMQNREQREAKSYPIRVYYSGYIKEHPSESTVILMVSVVQT